MTPTFIKSFRALAAVAGYLIVKAGVDGVAVATSETDPLIGAADSMGAPADGMLDVIQGGHGEVRAGGTFAFGDPLTADAQGRAVKAVPVAGKLVRIIGFAMQDADENDIVPYLFAPGCIAAA
ncbi:MULTISPECIES: DUF2190 family protein [Brucella]|uniref:Uncharacterized protein n=1 Tax=Brucella intermedia M86 TaxID=1234597 RepID=M5JZX5_9HYPH|nr:MULTISPECIES: DUF2190 family protein [Brucella]ELT49071.1 hypothetical protein D584_11102 [Brucella intermedia M86]KAB2752279.1 hypothetical protein F9L05_03980 [Brucella anthropi]MCR5941639.1 hypothetical protein [Ochrobactrum sp. XJ1]